MRHAGRKGDLTASRALLALIDASYYGDVDDDIYFMFVFYVCDGDYNHDDYDDDFGYVKGYPVFDS